MLFVTLILSILLATLVLLYQWCQFKPVTETSISTANGIKYHFSDFLAGQTTCQIWAFSFTMPRSLNDFTSGLSANIGAVGNQWSNSESFRFILVAYINIIILVLIYAYICLKNLNQYMEERRKARMASVNSKKRQRVVWSSNATMATANERTKPSYVKLPTPDS